MSNPFSKKNPFMSLWLSGANKVVGAGRGHFLAAARRQQAALTRDANKMVADFWSQALKPPSRRRKSKK